MGWPRRFVSSRVVHGILYGKIAELMMETTPKMM